MPDYIRPGTASSKAGGDARGFEIGHRDEVRRIEFRQRITAGDQLHRAYLDLFAPS